MIDCTVNTGATNHVMMTWHSLQEVKDSRKEWLGESVGFVPTMGALHEGHFALIQRSKALCKRTVVSIFVNPLQFGPQEDFARYPRSLEDDLSACRALGVDAVFIPTVEMMYPSTKLDKAVDTAHTSQTTIVLPPSHLTDQYCGQSRPGFFTGVATVVIKLFHIIQPDVAVFGEKDAQQLAVIKALVNDLNLPVRIEPHPTVRDERGIALSSRLRYLSTPAQHESALMPSRILKGIQHEFTQAARAQDKGSFMLSKESVFERVVADLLGKPGDQGPEAFKIDYLDVVDEDTFRSQPALKAGYRLLIAGYVGSIRLIDNHCLTL
ncbi:MAG: pantoate--beta-alanine ligase [Cyanobacteria bacterium]|nr:pantoate--beta-alanine ligase [Cyanobacteriota bacterium]